MYKTPINPFLVPDQQVKNLRDFYNINLKQIDKFFSTKKSDYFDKLGEKMALMLFSSAAKRVPAYKKFLKKHKVNPASIKTIKDFKEVPHTDKNNYLRKYPLEQLCWNGKIENYNLFSVSSGSTGVPFFWPRGDGLEIETSLSHALFFIKSFEVDTHSTLLINSFSMGIYIAGVITLNSSLRAAELGIPLTIISPGIEINDILRAIQELGKKYAQIILAGYPPFIKDVLTEGDQRKINWKKYKIKFLFATEGFTEAFRDYVLKKVGAQNTTKDSLNIYGSADAGILGHETPSSIHTRRVAAKNRAVFNALWGNNSFVPTFVQYNPAHKYFEEENNELLFSAYGGLPLVRYNIHDTGKIHSFNDIANMPELIKNEGKKIIKENWQFPFLSIFGKTDLTISFYGLMIYPENIKAGIENKKVASMLTGRFFMHKKEEKNTEQTWEIILELAKNIKAKKTLKKRVLLLVLESLRAHNLEYDRLYSALGKRAEPEISFIKYGSNKLFDKNVIKQRWTPNKSA